MKKRFAKRIKQVKSKKRRQEVLAAYHGWCKHGDCKNLWNLLTDNYMGFRKKESDKVTRQKTARSFTMLARLD